MEPEASTTTEAVQRALRARVPRRRTQLSRGRDIEEVTRDYVSSEVPRENLRTRARLPRRRVNVNRDLERNERNALVSGFSVVTINFSNEIETAKNINFNCQKITRVKVHLLI